jgi:hypothetical protein
MIDLLNDPLPFFLVCLGVLWLSVHTGAHFRRPAARG